MVTCSVSERNEMLEGYLHYAEVCASRSIRYLPASVDREDLVGEGFLALVKAADRYDPDRGVKFSTLAHRWISCAILELLRNEDWVPRSVRDRIKALDRAYSELELRQGRNPSLEELASELDISIEGVHQLLAERQRALVESLETVVVENRDKEHVRYSDVLPDTINTYDEAERRCVNAVLAQAISSLPQREQRVIAMRHYEEMTYSAIAKKIGVSEARAYQLYRKALGRLRQTLTEDASLMDWFA